MGKESSRQRLEHMCQEVAEFAKSRLANMVIADFVRDPVPHPAGC